MSQSLSSMTNVRCLTVNGNLHEWHRCISRKLFAMLKSSIFPSLTSIYLVELVGIPFTILALPRLRHMTLKYSNSIRGETSIPEDLPRHSLRTIVFFYYQFENHQENTSLVAFLAHSYGQLESLASKGEPPQMLDVFMSLYKSTLEILNAGSLLCTSFFTIRKTTQ